MEGVSPRGADTKGRGRRDPRLWILVAIVTAALIAVGITWAWANALFAPGGFDDLRFTVVTDKPSYAPGENVTVVTSLTNVGGAPVRLAYRDSCGNHARFSDANETIWFITGGEEVCLQVIVEFTLFPGQSIVESFVWSQEDFEGRQVPTGQTYRASVGGGIVMGEDRAVFGHSPWFLVLAES